MNALTWLVLGQLAGVTGTVTVSDRTEARLRSVPDERPAVDVETVPTIGMALGTRRTSAGLAYGLRLAAIDIGGENDGTVVQQLGHVDLGWQVSRRLRLRLSHDIAIGREVLAALTGPGLDTEPEPGVPPVSFVPREQTLYTIAMRSAAGFDYELNRRWDTSLTGYYEITGGMDTDAQEVIPRRTTEGGELTVGYQLTPADRLVTSLQGSHTDVSTGNAFVTATLLETWTRNWSPRTRSELGAGVAYLVTHGTDEVPEDTNVLPAGRGSIETVREGPRGGRLTLRANSAIETGYNPLLGVVTYVASAGGTAIWSRRRWAVETTVTASTTIEIDTETPSIRGVSGNVIGTYDASRYLEFQAGLRAADALFPGASLGDTPLQWVVFGAVSVAAPIAHF